MNESSQLSWDLGDFDNSADFVGNDEIMHEMDDEGPYLEDIHLVSNEDGVLYAEEDENTEEGLVDENIIMMQEPIAEDPFHIYHAVMPHKATDHHPTSPDLYRETHSASSHTKTGHEREARPRSLYRHVSWSTPRRVVSPGQSVLDATAFSFSSQMVASPSPISGVAGGTTPSSSGDFQESLQQLAACLRQSEVTRKMIMYQQHRQQSNGSAFSGPFSVDELDDAFYLRSKDRVTAITHQEGPWFKEANQPVYTKMLYDHRRYQVPTGADLHLPPWNSSWPSWSCSTPFVPHSSLLCEV
eukprot:CAMPEP_0178770910 /NCGR_PEP_ID=MMETSP0744-20121128/21655_1 /TAXON_ID=913974 /ORGANISM="Nitzschia punctata, Strain CCMP561" /LENGTH=298 /DNA_ID=CAMNT_0020427341 /DNA_START=181 /DNA_END=1078 /DNA_ORIENTATION=-